MTRTIPTLTLNNGVEMPALGLGVFQTPPDETGDAVEAALARRLPPHRHRRRLRQRARGRRRRSAAPGVDRDEVFIETKVWISDYGYDETLHALRQERRQARRRPDRPADPAPGAAVGASTRPSTAYRALETLLADGKVRAIGVSNFMVEHLDRAARPRPTSCRPSTRSRCTRTSSSPSVQALRRRARHPHPGVVADRRHHLLPRRQHEQHLRGPDASSRSPSAARQDPRAGDAALAPAAGPLGDPEVDQAPPHRRELRRLRLRAHRRRARRDRRARHRRARRARAGRRSPSRASAATIPEA